MYQKVYLLSLEDFLTETDPDQTGGKALLERAFLCVDDARREKAEGMRPGRARAASLGAGLLLQLAVGEAVSGRGTSDSERRDAPGLEPYSAHFLVDEVERRPRLSLAYAYGEKGKPYFREHPFYFSLSHSGDYVLCVLSNQEVGADIQQHCGKDVGKLARRFFSEREAMALEQAGAAREELFYRLWARKEAYGKLTGRGVADALKVDLLPGKAISAEHGSSPGRIHAASGAGLAEEGVTLQEEALGDSGWVSEITPMSGKKALLWEEYGGVVGYSIALCRYGQAAYFS